MKFGESAFSSRTFRFGNRIDLQSMPEARQFDTRQVEEIAEFLQERGQLHTVDGFLKDPFAPKLGPRSPSRFSDGSFPVYYSALERETALAEATDNLRKLAIDGATGRRAAFFRCVSCQFDGTVADFVSKLPKMMYLVKDTGYTKCQQLAAKTRAARIDALVTPSAAQWRRNSAGNCLPVFTEKSLSAPTEEVPTRFEF